MSPSTNALIDHKAARVRQEYADLTPGRSWHPPEWFGGSGRPFDRIKSLGLCLTFARFPLLGLSLLCVTTGRVGDLLLLIIAAIVLCDIFDGIVFEWSSASEDDVRIRHVVDAFGDRVVIHSLFAVALGFNLIGFVAYLPVLGRELLLIWVVSRPYRKDQLILQANLPSKVGTVLVAVLFYMALNGRANEPLVLLAFVAFSAIGLRAYARGRERLDVG